jgi:hypothetical protein
VRLPECKACVESLARRHGLPETSPGRSWPSLCLCGRVWAACYRKRGMPPNPKAT